MRSTCRSCGAAIFWARTTGGKRMPLDLEPDPERGTVLVGWVGGEEIAVVLAAGELASSRANRDKLHVSHFATCPQAAEWRKPAVAAEAAQATRETGR